MADVALIAAGAIGAMVSLVHGALLQRLMIRPILESGAQKTPLTATSLRLLAPLLHFSTVCWLGGGLALIAAPFWFDSSARTTLAVIVGAFYTFGALGNFWATRGRHFGWIPLVVAVALICYGA